MPDISVMFPNDYLAAADLQGKDCEVTIESVTQEALKTTDGQSEDKWILRFVGKRKKMVCNKTNAKLIAAYLNERDSDNWPNKSIILYPTTCQAFGKTEPCIRVRPPKGGVR